MISETERTILSFVSSVMFFIGGFLFGKAHELRKLSNEYRKLADECRDIVSAREKLIGYQRYATEKATQETSSRSGSKVLPQ